MAMAAFGTEASEECLAGTCGIGIRGTTVSGLAEAARQRGFKSETVSSETALSQLDRAVVHHRPLIALIGGSVLIGRLFEHGHFVVVTDTDDDFVYFHDPEQGPRRRVDRALFVLSWAYYELRGVIVWT